MEAAEQSIIFSLRVKYLVTRNKIVTTHHKGLSIHGNPVFGLLVIPIFIAFPAAGYPCALLACVVQINARVFIVTSVADV